MRQGFGLIQALIVIVLISGIMVIAMKYAQVTVKQTSDLYVRESADLFMDSAVELSLLAISGYDRETNNNCLKDVFILSPDQRFKANVSIVHYYLFNGVDNNGSWYVTCNDRNISIQTEESHGMVMLEVTVETNATHPKNQGKQIRLTRRTLQRP